VSPDIVGFQEIDFGGSRAFGANQMRSLARRLNYRAGAEAVNWNKHYVPYPYGINPSVHFGRVVSGQGVLSRFPITDHRRVELARTSRPFWSDAFYLDRLAQITTLDVGRPLTVINVHLEAFEEATRETQAETVRQLYAEHAAEGPTLLIGDFNAVHPAAKNADRLSPSVARQFDGDQTIETILEGTNLQEALPDSLYRRPVAFTYPADGPNRKIDHIFYDPDTFTPVQGNVWCTPPSAPDSSPPSDHCAMVLRLAFRSDGGA
jgi:endonuclease/exonuclease/phosphatase family metal-dependent hydrolase